jgi:hypothetical protein
LTAGKNLISELMEGWRGRAEVQKSGLALAAVWLGFGSNVL